MSDTRRRIFFLIGIVALGVASRLLATGLRFFDNYLGDALYAAMVFELLLIAPPRWSPYRAAALAWLIVVAIEVFQLSGIPSSLREHGNPLLSLLSVVLGTTFSGADIVFYALGAAVFLALELYLRRRIREQAGDGG